MRFSLPLRIFLVHLTFTVGAAALAVVLVGYSFQRYKTEWQKQVETLSTEAVFQPFANEVARSLLLRLDQGFPEEVRERDRQRVSEGITVLLHELPSIESLLIVDREGRIMYSSDPDTLDLGFTGARDASFFAASDIVRRRVENAAGEPVTEVMVPVYENPGPRAAGGDRRRLGSLIVHYRRDAAMMARVPALEPPDVDTRTFVVPLMLYLAAVALGGVIIAALTGRPVRRLDSALVDYRARGFRGGLQVGHSGMQREFASAVSAINELGGRLEALDAQGRERESLLATLGQSLEDGMVALDPQGVPVAWNPAALRMLGLVRDAGASGEPEGRERERERLLRALMRNPGLGGLEPESRIERQEMQVVCPDGAAVAVEVTRVPFEFRPGRQGSLLLMRDLAALSKVEAHLLEAGRFAVLAHLAAGLAHEIRNPLHAIGLNAGVVEQYVGREPTEQSQRAMRESLFSIKDETRRLTELLNNYLGLVRPEREPGPVEVPELCARVHHLLAYTAAQSNVEIRVSGDEEVPPVTAVPGQLQQAILNLALNSIQAMPDGGVLRLETRYRDGEVVLTVADTGPGLPAELQAQPFEVRSSGRPGGTGLGLPLVKIIAELHGGRVAYRDGSGGGAAFVLSLPTRAAA